MFEQRLRQAMKELQLKQVQVAGLTGKSRGAISQYLSGDRVPPDKVQREMAIALGLEADYFARREIKPVKETAEEHARARRRGAIRKMTVPDAAKILGVDQRTVSKGLQQSVFPWGYAIHTTENRWVYIINADAFERIEGVEL